MNAYDVVIGYRADDAYHEMYLNKVRTAIADMFDFAIHDFGLDSKDFVLISRYYYIVLTDSSFYYGAVCVRIYI